MMNLKEDQENSKGYTWGQNCKGWHLLNTDSLSVIEEEMPPGTAEVVHYHEKAQQFFYILQGTASFEMDGETKVIARNEYLEVPPKTLHSVANNGKEALRFLLVSEPKAHGDRIDIIPFSEALTEHVKKLNYEWLEKYFMVEPGDITSLSNPKREIIDKGGIILFARWQDEIVGTASLLKLTEEVYELGKMVVTEKAQGHFIGHALMKRCLQLAEKMKLKKLVLYSNTALETALHLYRKYGFVEVAHEEGHYQRSNIKMEKQF